MKTILILLVVLFTVNDGDCYMNIAHQRLARFRFGLSMQASPQNERNHEKISVAIVGSGAVGCFYAARLWESQEYNLLFHMRGDHYKVSKEKGLNITSSIVDDVFIPPNELKVYENTKDMGKVDWIIVALKSTAMEAVPSLLLPLLDKNENCRVVAIMNGLVDDDIVRLIEGQGEDEAPVLTKCAAVYAGMALLCSNKLAPGHIDHSYAGKLTCSLSQSSPSDFSDESTHKKAMEDLWKPTKGFEFVYDDNVVRSRWSKNCWNLPFNGISVAMGGITVDKIVNDVGLRQLAYTVIDETIAAGNKDLEVRGFGEETYLGEQEKNAMMALSDAMGPYVTSTCLDLRSGRPLESKYLFGKAVQRADELGVPVPTLRTLVTQIEAIQRLRAM